jgi:hypothetical protein
VLLVSAADFDAACANLTHPTDTITLSATPLTPDGEGGYTADPSPSPVHSVSPQDWVVRRGENAEVHRQLRVRRLLSNVSQLPDIEASTSVFVKAKHSNWVRQVR